MRASRGRGSFLFCEGELFGFIFRECRAFGNEYRQLLGNYAEGELVGVYYLAVEADIAGLFEAYLNELCAAVFDEIAELFHIQIFARAVVAHDADKFKS